jgi:hypothetical protein
MGLLIRNARVLTPAGESRPRKSLHEELDQLTSTSAVQGLQPGHSMAMTTLSSETSVWPAARAISSWLAPTKSARHGEDFTPPGYEIFGLEAACP